MKCNFSGRIAILFKVKEKFKTFFSVKTTFFAAVFILLGAAAFFSGNTADTRQASKSAIPGNISHEQNTAAILFSSQTNSPQNTLLRRNRKVPAGTSSPFANESIICKSSVIAILPQKKTQYCFDGGKTIFHRFLKFSLPLRAGPYMI